MFARAGRTCSGGFGATPACAAGRLRSDERGVCALDSWSIATPTLEHRQGWLRLAGGCDIYPESDTFGSFCNYLPNYKYKLAAKAPKPLLENLS